ncbi:MAG: hypothetical protein ABEJ35_06435 [Halobacteriaceae archaeon]
MSRSVSAVDSARLGYGAVAGAVAFLINYALAYVLWTATSFPETAEGILREFAFNQVADWVFAGWLLYGAHFVDIEFSNLFGFPVGRATLNAVSVVDQTSTSLLYVVVPAVLIAAGIALARAHGAVSFSDGAITGAATAIGYFPLVAIGIYLFGTTGQLGEASPVFGMAIILAGVVYPTLLGALGGVIATTID